jgi:hypothetical protein
MYATAAKAATAPLSRATFNAHPTDKSLFLYRDKKLYTSHVDCQYFAGFLPLLMVYFQANE